MTDEERDDRDKRRERDKGAYARPIGYVAGPDDESPATAGSDEKAVAADAGDAESYGPSPHPMPEEPQGEGGDPGFRVRGPVDEAEHGMIVDEEGGEPEEPGTGLHGGEHIGPEVDWVPSDEADDPDGGSGRTDAGDGGYLPGEGTGRPY